MKTPKRLDTVRMTSYREGGVNELALVWSVRDTDVWLVNGNMPFIGTLNFFAPIHSFTEKDGEWFCNAIDPRSTQDLA